MIREYLRLLEWRRHVKPVVEAACEEAPGAAVYVAGGAAEDRLTALSDIDVVVALPLELSPSSRLDLKLRILDRAFEKGLPLDYPIDLHVIGPAELERYKRLGRLVELARCPPDHQD